MDLTTNTTTTVDWLAAKDIVINAYYLDPRVDLPNVQSNLNAGLISPALDPQIPLFQSK
jgi:hypothetical protein